MPLPEYEDFRLHKAAMRDSLDELRSLIDSGLKDFRGIAWYVKNKEDLKFAGQTALDIAAKRNNVASVELLVPAGSDRDQRLMVAASYGSNEMVKVLLEGWRGDNMHSSAMSAHTYETIRKLLAAGMDLKPHLRIISVANLSLRREKRSVNSKNHMKVMLPAGPSRFLQSSLRGGVRLSNHESSPQPSNPNDFILHFLQSFITQHWHDGSRYRHRDSGFDPQMA
jgi:ankyrin repeat protein